MISRKAFNRLLAAGALSGVLSGLFAAASRPALAEDFPDTIRIGDVGFGFGQPFGRGLIAIADAKGFLADEFKDTPVKLQFTYFVNTGPAINEAFAEFFTDPPPARVTIGVAALPKGALVEISALVPLP